MARAPKVWTCRRCGFCQPIVGEMKACTSAACSAKHTKRAGDSRPETRVRR